MTRREDKMPVDGLLFVSAGEFDTLTPSFDFIPDVAHDGTVVIIYAPPRIGKTFFALHLLCSTALGRTVFGLATEKRHGLYVGLEGEAGIKARIAAWCVQYGVASNPIDYALGRFSLAIEDDVAGLIVRMKRRRIGFVVIDTLSLAMAGLDEIAGQHMSLVIEALHRIKRETGACVVVVAHTGKNEKAGIRGHSSQLGNVDTTIELVAHNKETKRVGNKVRIIEHEITLATPRSAVVRKQRDAEGGKRLNFTLVLRDTPFTDARGATVKRPALCEHEAFPDLPPEGAPTPKLTKREREAMEILDALNRKLGRSGPANIDQFQRALKREKWGPDNFATWRSVFRNLRQKLDLDSSGAVLGIL